MGYLEQLSHWMLGFGQAYGVNPFIFALLYFGTIPFSLIAFSQLILRLRSGQSTFLPLLVLFLSFIGTYVYLFWAGRNIPWWVYALVLVMMVYSAVVLYRKIRQQVGMAKEDI
ncbi:MAG: hypothetical protein AAFP19_04915 [Bacteroidota bacterium]